jgi:hypothetical protein
MAITEGTNAGFVASYPAGDPGGTNTTAVDTYAYAAKFTSPSDATAIDKMGAWLTYSLGGTDFEMGIYSHDSANDRPDQLLFSVTGTKTLGEGWKTLTFSNEISGNTIYWLACQVDDTAITTSNDFDYPASYRTVYKNSQTSLPSSWGTSDTTVTTRILALYAEYTTTPAESGIKINIGDVWKDVTKVEVNIGDVWKTVTKGEVNIGDVWKTFYGS